MLGLSRLAIAPGVPKNAASFLLMRSVRLVWQDKRWNALLTFADEWQAHEGRIYKVCGWTSLGRTKPTDKWVDSTGRQVSLKATKTRTVTEMERLGHRRIGKFAKHRFLLERR